jgi:hypothetical protein
VLVGLAFHQPMLCANATWNSTGRTFASTSIVGSEPHAVFVTTKDSIYVSSRGFHSVIMWKDGGLNLVRNFSSGLTSPRGLFVTETNDLYVDNGNTAGQVERWLADGTRGDPMMRVCSSCQDIFVDIMNNIYCSLLSTHRIVSNSLVDRVYIWQTVAGTGGAGGSSTMLNSPYGIFVDEGLNLYVADWGNHRIQYFQEGERNGTTIVASSVPNTIALYHPIDVMLDGNGYMFIVENYNHRIIRSGPNGFRCILGCSGSGSGANQFSYPRIMAFDSRGNIFVADTNNHRIQTFNLISNQCRKSCFDIENATLEDTL